MPRICYREIRFTEKTRATLAQINEIIQKYLDQGFILTVRQIHYQFITRVWHESTTKNYKRLISICSNGRLAGVIDWEAIEDRARGLEALTHWDDPSHIIVSAAESFRLDKWESQPCRVEVWIEKAALAGIFDRACKELDVAYLACIGYNSWSEMWLAANRLRNYEKAGQRTIILHFANHDPEGLDMTRDIRDRMATLGASPEVRRLALNLDQVKKYKPPPNFAKESSSRFDWYVKTYRTEKCWELDALDPIVLAELVRTEIQAVRDEEQWQESVKAENEGRRLLEGASNRWKDVTAFLEKEGIQ